MNKPTINTRKTFKIVALFVLAFATTSLIPTEVITMERSIPNILFLLVSFTILVNFFKADIEAFVKKTKKSEFSLVLVSLLIHAVATYFLLNFVDQPIWPFDAKGASPLLLNEFFIWVKPFDVLVQQTLILILVSKLTKNNMNSKQITVLFIIGFGLIHLAQIVKTDLIVGLSFTTIAVFFAVLFPNLILKTRNGYLYNYMIHLGTYDLAATLAWLLF